MTAKRTRERTLLSMLIVGLAALVAGGSAYSAFSATTANEGNQFATGTVVIGDNSAGSSMYQVSNQAPGHPVERCIAVAYTGSVEAGVRMYASPVSALGDHIELTVTAGSLPDGTTFPDCTGFTAANVVFDSTLKAFTDNRQDWGSGLAVVPPGKASWSTGDTVVYRFRLNVVSTAPQAATTGEHRFTWEARSL
jgi:predicted ribosomally synthesized peptide with SipW-like signal peptide